MDAPKDRQSIPSWLPLVILIAISLALHGWVIARTEVVARDSIGFIRTALRFEQEPWTQVVRTSEQPPGYALAILLVSRPLRAISGTTNLDTMVLAAQFASALMSVLAIIPMVRLGRELGNRRIGWLAAGVLVALPGITRLTSDGLSEGTFLFWVSLTLWLGVRALRRPSLGRMLACGLGIAAAYLTRPEGLELALAAGIALLALQIWVATRQSWRRVGTQMAALACGVLAGVGPYVAITGHLSNKNTVKVLVGDADADPARMLPYGQTQAPAAVRTFLAVWLQESQNWHGPRWLWSLQALGQETAQGFQYVGLGLAVLGLFVWQRRSGSLGGAILLAGLVMLHVLLLCRMASLSGYLSERHVLILILAGCLPAGAALLWIGRRLRPAAGFATACAILGVLLVCEMSVLWKPLHGNRAGHKAAGRYLAQVTTPDDEIIDPFAWAEFYAHPPLPPPPPSDPKNYFVVLENNGNSHSRLPLLADARLTASFGQIVYHWPENKPRESASVLVYRVTAAQFGK
jgi:Dolichyl-phosphate-mannose-protein mannosyltransferase